MAAALRQLDECAPSAGLRATYEATHHGPELRSPAFFVEIGYGDRTEPSADAVRMLAEVIPNLRPEPGDRVALGAGGGHYAPHFTELVLRRRWAMGHILSRHALEGIDRETAAAALAFSPTAEGIVFARSADADHVALRGLAPRLRDGDAPAREAPRRTGDVTPDGRSSSGT
jgi:D-aminoacyl-tRNA deacylase